MADKAKTIVIIEDEEPLLESYKELLTGCGYTVQTAVDGYKGMDILEKNKGEVDLILLDLMMPGIDGLEVLRSVKKDGDKYGDAPVVILTAMVSDQVIEECYENGAVSYLIKSELDTEDFVKEVERIFEKEVE